MAKILFITLYDEICVGVRLLSAIAKECGMESHIILFKGETSYVPIWVDKDEYSTYQYYYNGLLRGSFYAVDPVTKIELEQLLELIQEISPAAICLSTRTFAYPICKDIFPLIKRKFPGIPIVAGGWGPTLEPEKFLEFCDYVCFGEGEQTIRSISESMKNGSNLKRVNNLIYYDDDKLVRNEVIKPLSANEMNLLPFPDFSVDHKYIIHDGKMMSVKEFYNEKVYDCFAARGCPLNCSYCMSSKYGAIYRERTNLICPKYRLRSVDVVLREVRLAKERGARFIRFKDEVFPISAKWLEEFLSRYPAEIGLPFFGFVRPEFHDDATIVTLKKVGLCVTMVGIQSGAKDILENIYGRKLPKEKIIAFANLLDQLKINFSYHFIYRNPFETEDNLKESLEFTYQLPYANVFIFKLEPLPGTPIFKMIKEIKPVPLNKATQNWYAILHSLSFKNHILRSIAKIIHRHQLFKHIPSLLTILFIPSLILEAIQVIKNKYYFKAKLHFSPKTK